MFSRDIKCDDCSAKGKIKAHDTEGKFPENLLFEPVGKTENGFMVFNCPQCNSNVIKSPYSFIFTTNVKVILTIIVCLVLIYFLK